MNAKSLYRFVGRKSAFWLALGSLAGLALGGVEMAFAAILQVLMKSLGFTSVVPTLPGGATLPDFSLAGVLFLFFAIGTLRAGMQFLIAQSAAISHELMSFRLKAMAVYELTRSKKGFLSSSRIQHQLSELFPKAVNFIELLTVSIPNGIYGAFVGILLLLTSPLLSLFGLIGIALTGIIVILFNRKVRQIAHHLPIENENLVQGVQRLIRNWLLLRAMRTLDLERSKLTQHASEYARHTVHANFWGHLGGVLPSGIGSLVVVGLIGIQMTWNPISGAQFFSFLYLFVRFVQILGGLATNLGHLSVNLPQFQNSLSYINSFSDDDLSFGTTPSPPLKLAQRSEFSPFTPPSIRFENVHFQYDPNGPLILDGLSFSVPAGQALGIQGKSGMGKSTLLALLLGILRPKNGRVTLNDIEASEYFEKHPRNVGFVSAEPFLIEGSIRENLCYGLSFKPTDEECISALRDSQLQEWFSTTDRGLDFRISENGDGLSSGQRQRLSFARAILRKPELLILDEPSANLDILTESHLANLIHSFKGKITTIIVSHREGMLKTCDLQITLGAE